MSADPARFQHALSNAKQAFKRGDRSAARKWAAEAARQDPEQEIPWLMLGALANPKAAPKYYQRALSVNPQSQLAKVGLQRARNRLASLQAEEHSRQLTGRFTQAAPAGEAAQRKTSPLLLIVAVTLLGIAAFFAFTGMPDLSGIVASAHLQPTATQPLRLSVRGNPLTPTPTPTPTSTPTPTPTPTFTPTPTATATPTATNTALPTATINSMPPGNLSSRPDGVGANEFWIEVNLSTQTLFAWKGDTKLKSFTVSTGTWATPTVIGQYRVYVKYVSTTMSGPGYYLPGVPYTMYFFKGYGIHGTYWHNNFGTPMSHGCVNMETSEASWVFDRAKIGTLVIIHY